MESEQASKRSSLSCENSPGSFPVEKSLCLDTNVVKDSKIFNFNASSGSTINGSSFVSSDEGFETAFEKSSLDNQGNGSTDISVVGGDSCETFVGFSQYSMLTKDVFVDFGDGGVGNNDKVGVLEGSEVDGKIVGNCEAFSGDDFSGTFIGVSQVSKSIKNEVGEVSDDVGKTNKVGVLDGGEAEEKLVDTCEGDDMSLRIYGSVNGMRQDNYLMEYKGDSCCVSSECGSLVPKEGFVGKGMNIMLKGDNVLDVDKIETLDSKTSDREMVEKHVVEQLSADIVQGTEGCFEVACKGNSVVEAVQVDLLGPGVEAGGEMKENKSGHSELMEDLNSVLKESSVGEDTDITLKCKVALEDVKVKGGEIGAEAILKNNVDQEVVLTCNSISYNANRFHALVDQTNTVAISPYKVEDKETGDAYLQPKETYDANLTVQNDIIENRISGKLLSHEFSELIISEKKPIEGENGMKVVMDGVSHTESLGSERVTDGMILRRFVAAKQFINELKPESSENSQLDAKSSPDYTQVIDGQNVMDSDGADTDDEEEEGKSLFNSSLLTAVLRAAAGVGSGGNMTITSQDLSRFISEWPASFGSSVQSFRPVARPSSSNFFRPSSFASAEDSVENLNKEEKRKLEKLQSIRVKFLRIVKRLGLSEDELLVARVLNHLGLVAGWKSGPLFGLDIAKRTALQLEEDRKEDTDFSLNILVLGKSGVGKSATINSIFGEERARIDAFKPATTTVNEITGVVDGVKIRVFDTPGLKSSAMEQSFNRSVLSSVKKFTKKIPLDAVLYVDRLDAKTRDLDDLPLLQTINVSLGSSVLRNAIITLTHAASMPPEGPSGFPRSYDAFITQRSSALQTSIRKAVGGQNISRNLMNQVCLVENHPQCQKNREGQKVLPNGQIWKQQLIILCYSIKILNEANSISEPQESFNFHRLFGYLSRSLLFLLSSTLQSQVHQKLLCSEQGRYNCDADIDLEELSDSDKDEYEDDEYEYDQLPPFKPLKKSQLSMLSKEQRKAYFEEYDYRVKALQKKQWKEELKRMKEVKMKDIDSTIDHGYTDEDPTDERSFPLPPPSFDSDEQVNVSRFLEPTCQFLAWPTLDTPGWDHDCGYCGVNLLKRIATSSKFPAEIHIQLTKDKKEFTIDLVSSIATKHGEKGSSMAGFDIRNIDGQPAYTIRGETKLKNFKKNKTAAGITITHTSENVVTGLKLEDQITFGRQYSLAASAGMVRSQQDVAYGANISIQRREHDYPIGQIQSILCLSMAWLRDKLCLMLDSSAHFSFGRNSKVDIRAVINRDLRGHISVRTSSSESPFMLASIMYAVISICKKFYPGEDKKFLPY